MEGVSYRALDLTAIFEAAMQGGKRMEA
jgi:hypothetical protein